ncbi:MAG: L-threonylcarbamoyladenylate synthase [Deltaproteobacteria bacterium]
MSDAIHTAAEALRRGELVAFPTETVYGLGAHALDVDAVTKIFEAKGRPRFDPLIVHVPSVDAARALFAAPPAALDRLAEEFWPGPLTVVAKKVDAVPDLVTAGHDTVAVRVPAHPMAKALLEAVALPVAAPSANPFGAVSPTRAEHVVAQLGDRVSIVLDGGPCDVGVESTIVALEPTPTLLRPGGIALESLERVLGRVTLPDAAEYTTASPGRLSKHYATATPLYLDPAEAPEGGRRGLLAFEAPADGYEVVEVLSPAGDLAEAAQRLFAAMRRLDALDLDVIVAEPVPETGLGRAIMDRLRRAAAKRGP